MKVTAEQAAALVGHDVTPLSGGAWSQAFGFTTGDGDFVVRFGEYRDDFERDRFAHRYAGPDLPIPEVVALGDAYGGHYAISTRAPGEPLEDCPAGEWGVVAGRVAAAMEAMRTAAIPPGSGWGGWDGSGQARKGSWREFLLSIAKRDERLGRWRTELDRIPEGAAAFERGLAELDDVAADDVPRAVLHGDMLNRNVHVAGGRLTGVFDWGCAAYGDPLYELAWFEFWAPWHPNLDVALLRRELGWEVDPVRLQACLLFIGLDHLAYNAHIGKPQEVLAVVARMRELSG